MQNFELICIECNTNQKECRDIEIEIVSETPQQVAYIKCKCLTCGAVGNLS